jgi:Domain of unknown function (DUF6458)
MGIGVSIFLIALGAILTFATEFDISGLDIDVVGVILMIAGVTGLLMDLLIWGPRRRTTSVVDEPPVVEERRVVDERPVVERRVVDERPVVEERRVVDERPVVERRVYDDRGTL